MATNNSTNNTPATPITVPNGGTGKTSFTPYAVIAAGTTGTAALQNISGLGTAGQVLISTGASSLPTWQNNPGGAAGAWVLLQTQTASSSANINFTAISGTYTTYIVICSGVIPSTTGVQFQMLFSTNGGSSYLSTGYNAGIAIYTTSTGPTFTSSTTFYPLSGASDVTTGFPVSGQIFLYGLGISTVPMATGTISIANATPSTGDKNGSLLCGYGSAITVNALRFQMSSGNITSGTFSLYGLTF